MLITLLYRHVSGGKNKLDQNETVRDHAGVSMSVGQQTADQHTHTHGEENRQLSSGGQGQFQGQFDIKPSGACLHNHNIQGTISSFGRGS